MEIKEKVHLCTIVSLYVFSNEAVIKELFVALFLV